VTATVALAAGAFLLSFVALRDLAVLAGITPTLAPVLPLVIDLAVAVATIALVAVIEPTRRSRGATPAATTTAPGTASPAVSSATPARALPARRDDSAATAPSCDGAEQTARLAAELVAAKLIRQLVETVQAILIATATGTR